MHKSSDYELCMTLTAKLFNLLKRLPLFWFVDVPIELFLLQIDIFKWITYTRYINEHLPLW